jgi:hypothetical protein
MKMSPPRCSTQRDRRRLAACRLKRRSGHAIKVAREGRPSQLSQRSSVSLHGEWLSQASPHDISQKTASRSERRRTPFSSSGERWPLLRRPTGVARQTCTYETATSLLCVDDGHIEQALDAGHGHLETRSIGRGKHRREWLIASPHYQHQLACS